mmetsp:Transcript_25080/g.62082  ORF Transcript_25080/g.62082 Transcript_25080/m.62082 type:complete len:129 (+) Transcript_25080:25-411(+)
MFDEQNLPGCLWLKSRETEKGHQAHEHPSIHPASPQCPQSPYCSTHAASHLAIPPASRGSKMTIRMSDERCPGSQPATIEADVYTTRAAFQAPRPHIHRLCIRERALLAMNASPIQGQRCDARVMSCP